MLKTRAFQSFHRILKSYSHSLDLICLTREAYKKIAKDASYSILDKIYKEATKYSANSSKFTDTEA